MSKKAKIIVIVGPNASGKSDYAVRLARRIGGEIISADSRQVYKGLNIGSGKITKKEMKGVWHYCLDIADPKKVFNAEDFQRCARKAIEDILSRGKTPILVGGTGFYIDAVLGRVKFGGVPPDPKLRAKLEKKSAGELLKILKKLDPARAKTVEQKNPRRLIRAIEIAYAQHSSSRKHAYSPAGELLCSCRRTAQGFLKEHASQCPLNQLGKSVLKTLRSPRGHGSAESGERGRVESATSHGARIVFSKGSLPSEVIWLGIKRPPEELKKRIHKRLIKRLPGIIREVKNLHFEEGVSWKRLFDLGLEYRYTSLYLRGKLTKEEFLRQLEIAIWHYAKRQMTWFKKNKEIRWISSKN